MVSRRRLDDRPIRPTGVPLTVVQHAVRLKQEAEQHAKRGHDENLRFTNSIELAVSNPCFELWALLHFQDQRAHIERDRTRGALRGHLADYEKSLDFPKMHPGYSGAVQRAQHLDREADRHGQSGRNPTTNVYRLTESIRNG